MTDLTRLFAFRIRCAEAEHRIQRQAGTKTMGADSVEQARARIDRQLADHEAYRNSLPTDRRTFIDRTIELLKEAIGWL